MPPVPGRGTRVGRPHGATRLEFKNFEIRLDVLGPDRDQASPRGLDQRRADPRARRDPSSRTRKPAAGTRPSPTRASPCSGPRSAPSRFCFERLDLEAHVADRARGRCRPCRRGSGPGRPSRCVPRRATSGVTVPTLGFGIRPRGPSIWPSLPTTRIASGLAITTSKSRSPPLHLLGEVFHADDVGAGLLRAPRRSRPA